jgi:hypothetical protein
MLSPGSFRYGIALMSKDNPAVIVAAGTLTVGFGALDVVVTVVPMPMLVTAGAMTTGNVMRYGVVEPVGVTSRVTLNVPSGVPGGAVPDRT